MSIEKDFKKLVAVRGKTVDTVELLKSWSSHEIDSITIHFTDTSTLHISASTYAGCNECDEDGSAITYLNIE